MLSAVSFLAGMLTGAAFGVVLYKVGAVRYSRVMGMLTLRDTKVMKFAFSAIATASILYGLAAALGIDDKLHIVPRVMPFMGAAHLVGGVLFGVGMGVAGLCPGTCVAKAAGGCGDKRFAGTASMLGLLAGTLTYALTKDRLVDAGVIAAQQKPLTLYGALGIPYAAGALALGGVIVVVIAVLDRLTPERVYEPSAAPRTVLDWVRGEWSWAASGVLAGVLIVAATAQGGYLGFSGAALALVGWGGHVVGHPLEVVPAMSDDLLWRAALIIGVIPGGFLAHRFSTPSKELATHPAPKVLDVRALVVAFFAGFVMSLGAMIGGGCTTGAFLSAWPTLSLGSFAMAGTFFAVSMATSNVRMLLAKTLDMQQAQAIGDRAYD